MTFYFFVTGTYGGFLIYKMLGDQNCSHRELSSWIVIAIASLFWIVVIPVSILEIFAKDKVKFDATIANSTMTEEDGSGLDTFIY